MRHFSHQRNRKLCYFPFASALWLMLFAPASFCAGLKPDIPLRYEEPKVLTGKIFQKNSDHKNVLFTFGREATRSGQSLDVSRDYKYPDGKVAAREQLHYEGNNLVSYELDELQIGARGRAEIREVSPGKKRIFFEYSSGETAKPKKDDEQWQPETLVSDMIAPFLVSHWDDLMSGRELKCRYIVIPRKETVGFTFKKSSELKQDSRDVVTIKMEATSRIIAALVDPIFFIVEKKVPHRVLEYIGRTTPKIKSGSRWVDLDAVTVFDWP